MDKSRLLWRSLYASSRSTRSFSNTARKPQQPWICTSCLHQQQRPLKPSTLLRQRQRQRQPPQHQQRRHQTNPADEPGFTSIVDHPPTIIRSGRRHNRWGLLVLATIPLTSFALGCWQVQRLGWKTELMAKFEDRLVRAPLPLPPRVDPAAVRDFDYRRVYARGRWRHEQEMLIGPRLLDGEDGFLVITPLERTEAEVETERAEKGSSSSDRGSSSSSSSSTILVCRGWIPKDKAAKRARSAESLPAGEVVVQGLLREPWKKNMFTPDNRPAENKWYFPDVLQMAAHTGSQPVWIEETMTPDLLVSYDRRSKGIPIGRAAEVNLRNNHAQYIFTWFSLCAATTVMLWMVIKRPPGGVSRRIRQNKEW